MPINTFTRLSPKRAACWPAIERFFGQLPPELFQQGVLLRHDLAHVFSDTGQFHALLSRPTDPPWLELPFWLLDDWKVPEGDARSALERRVFAALVCLTGAAYVQASIRDDAHTFDAHFQGIERALHDEAHAELAHLFPEASPFWERYHHCLETQSQAIEAPVDWASASPEEAHHHLAAQLALGQIPAIALAMARSETPPILLAELLSVIEALHLCLAILLDVLNLRRDAHAGRLSYTISRAVRAARLEWSPSLPPEQILGTAVLTGSVRHIAEECQARLAQEIDRAQALGLPTLAAYTQELQTQFNELHSLFSLSASGHNAATTLRFSAPQNPLRQAPAMAEAYLLADRDFRESWEVQRRGVLEVAELTGRMFGPGLILEVLCQYHDVADDISAWLAALARDGFRYYPHPSVPPDADDVGLALRLLPHSANSAEQRQLLEPPLRRLRANVADDGHIPCWFTRGVEGLDTQAPLALWGNHCATVEANVLLGLLVYAPEAYRDLIARSARRWLDRWRVSGLGANSLYAPAYALWTAARLLGALDSSSMIAISSDDLTPAINRLTVEARHMASAQSAAFLALACQHPALMPYFDPGWISLIVKQQRYDGSWPGEPLFVTPTRGELAAWYSSAAVTTAYCYQALRISSTR